MDKFIPTMRLIDELKSLEAKFGNEGSKFFLQPVTGERLSDLVYLSVRLAERVLELEKLIREPQEPKP